MGSLNHIGSPTALRRELFHGGFGAQVMLLMLETWQSFSLNHVGIRRENRLTALFRDALIKAYVAAGRNWFVTLEDPITDPDYGTELGRNDIRFYPPKNCGQTVYFTVEAKRLRVKTEHGFVHLADKYVKEGIMRFVDCKYSKSIPCGGMMGYVMDNQISQAFEAVRKEIASNCEVLKMQTTKNIQIPSKALPDYEWSADTLHDRTNEIFNLYHVLLGVPS